MRPSSLQASQSRRFCPSFCEAMNMAKRNYPELTAQDVAALQAFAAYWTARKKARKTPLTWKRQLAEVYWYNARIWEQADGNSDMGHTLHGLRNSHGPEWLDTYRHAYPLN